MAEQKLPKLTYEYNALEPFIDAKTMKIHHTKHHQAYIDKLNNVLKKYKRLQNRPMEKLLINNRLPKSDRNLIRNNAGGHLNHTFFWKLLKKGTHPKGEILKAIKNKFSNFDKFKAEFTEASMKLFGSGWTWLILNEKKELEILTTPNQENPISQGKIALLSLDLWEHAYYLKYKNKRLDYIDSFFNIINWNQVNQNYLEAIKNF